MDDAEMWLKAIDEVDISLSTKTPHGEIIIKLLLFPLMLIWSAIFAETSTHDVPLYLKIYSLYFFNSPFSKSIKFPSKLYFLRYLDPKELIF